MLTSLLQIEWGFRVGLLWFAWWSQRGGGNSFPLLMMKVTIWHFVWWHSFFFQFWFFAWIDTAVTFKVLLCSFDILDTWIAEGCGHILLYCPVSEPWNGRLDGMQCGEAATVAMKSTLWRKFNPACRQNAFLWKAALELGICKPTER